MSGPIQTTSRDLFTDIFFTKSTRIDKLQSDFNEAKRKLFHYQKELMTLKSAEMRVLQNMNRYMKFNEVQNYLPADRYQTQEPLPMVTPSDNMNQDPDAKINYSRRMLMQGMEKYQMERDRLGALIKDIGLKIRQLTETVKRSQIALQANGADVSTYVAKDGIAKRIYSEIYMLYELHKRYRDLSMGPDGKTRQYSSSPSSVDEYQQISSRFSAYAERNPYVLDGELKLDYADPGSAFNEDSLKNMLEKLRTVLAEKNLSYDKALQTYSQQLESNISDPFISRHISRQNDSKRTPPASNALNSVTQTLSNLSTKLNNVFADIGISFYAFYDSTNYVEACNNYARRNFSGLNNNMPMCSAPNKSQQELGQEKERQEQAQAELDGAQLLTSQFQKAGNAEDATTIDKTFKKMMTDLSSSISLASGTNASSLNVIGTKTVTIEQIVYSTGTLYGVRILNEAQRIFDYLQKSYIEGLSSALYNVYVAELQQALNGVTGITKQSINDVQIK